MSEPRATIGPVPLNFTAIDFETANSSPASACSVGLVKVRGGRVVDRASWFIQPPTGHDAFLEWNTRIHGIVASDVVGAKGWAEQYADIVAFAEGDVLVAHNARFDMGVIAGGCSATGTELAEHHSLCSLQVARKTYALESYRLPMAARQRGTSASSTTTRPRTPRPAPPSSCTPPASTGATRSRRSGRRRACTSRRSDRVPSSPGRRRSRGSRACRTAR